MVSLTGGKKFSKLDLSSAYQQMPLQEGSRKYTTINKCHMLFRQHPGNRCLRSGTLAQPQGSACEDETEWQSFEADQM